MQKYENIGLTFRDFYFVSLLSVETKGSMLVYAFKCFCMNLLSFHRASKKFKYCVCYCYFINLWEHCYPAPVAYLLHIPPEYCNKICQHGKERMFVTQVLNV